MKNRFALAALVAAVSQFAFAADPYFAQVDASFAAMLSHPSYSGATAVTVVRGEIDPAAAFIYASLRGEPPTMIAAAQDPVLASFERMLAHQPYPGVTATKVARDADYQVDRLVFARRLEPARSHTVVAGK